MVSFVSTFVFLRGPPAIITGRREPQRGFCILGRIRACMPSEVVQFREDSDRLAFLRERDINPNELAREAFRATFRRLQAEEVAERLEQIELDLPRPVEELVREDRDAR